MSLLNDIVAGKKLKSAIEDTTLRKIWLEFLRVADEKQKLVGVLKPDNLSLLQQLQTLLRTELADFSETEISEEALVHAINLAQVERQSEQLARLEACLRYADTKHEYVHALLEKLLASLTAQAQLVSRLLKGATPAQLFIDHLKQQCALEHAIIAKIGELKTFHALALALSQRDYLLKRLDAREKRFAAKLNALERKLPQKMLKQWADIARRMLQETIEEEVTNETAHEHSDFEIVNSPRFVAIASAAAKELRSKDVSSGMLAAWIKLFRDSYNDKD